MAQAITRESGARRGLFARPAAREALTGWLFALPWVLGFLLFTAGPMIVSLYASFTRYNMIAQPR